MSNLIQSVVLAEIGRVADLSTHQQYQIAAWLLDHGVRFASQEQKHRFPVLANGMTVETFQAIGDLCLQDKRIQAIKEVRSWAIGQGSSHPLNSLKAAKDFIDEHFPRPIDVTGQS